MRSYKSNNGSFIVNQRVSTSTSSGHVTVDRWRVERGNNSAPISQTHASITSGAPYDAL